MYLVDITVFIDWFINLMASGITNTFNFFDSLTFHGISLLDFCLALILIPAGVEIFIAISKVSSGAADLAYRGGKAAKDFKKSFDDIDQI